MTSRGLGIHGCFSSFSSGITLLHIILYFTDLFDYASCQVFNEYTFISIFLQIFLFFKVLSQKISNCLVVYFQIRTPNEKFLLHILSVIEVMENMIKCIWNDTSFIFSSSLNTNHCVSLTTSSLSVCKYCSIVT